MVKCAIALGSNLGHSLDILERSLLVLQQTPGINLIATSNWYQTKPVGGRQPQADYLNGCALLEVKQTPQELLLILQATELQFGRVRTEKWSARTLDLDLLLYQDLILNSPELIVPHPRMTERAFVLVPLAEIIPQWLEPVSGATISHLAQQIDASQVRLWESV